MDYEGSNFNEYGNEAARTVEQSAAEIFSMINKLSEKDKDRALAFLEGVSENSVALLGGWIENMNKRAFPVEALRQQFDVVAERVTTDCDVTGETKENPNMEEHINRMIPQSARRIKTVAKMLGVDEQLLDEVIPPEDL